MAKVSTELINARKQRDALYTVMYSEIIAERPDPGIVTTEQRDLARDAVTARIIAAYALADNPAPEYATLYDPTAMAYINACEHIAELSTSIS